MERYQDYVVVWEINISAKTPEDAALIARTIQGDVDSTATHFSVTDEEGNRVSVYANEVPRRCIESTER